MSAAETIVRLHITDIAFGGDGVGHDADGRTIFVPFAALDDHLDVRIVETHSSFARGEIVELREPGPGRTVPRCPHFGRCGGCAYQHLTYEAELDAKRGQLRSLLQRLGGLPDPPEPEAVVASPTLYGYRNKIKVEPRLETLNNDERDVSYGYCERDNSTFFHLDACPLAHPSLNHLLSRAPRTALGKRNAKRPKPMPMTLRVTRDGTTAFYFGRAPKRIPWLHEQLLGREVSVPLGSFWQVNPEVADLLVDRVGKWFREMPTRTFIDAYSGVGTFSLGIGDSVSTRFLIESDEQALRASVYNHTQWGFDACHFRRGTTEHELPGLLAASNLRKTTVLLDPPRRGCGKKALQALCDFSPHQVIVVSCNAATLARDLKVLTRQGGYRLARLALFDMFPRTSHFETVALLEPI